MLRNFVRSKSSILNDWLWHLLRTNWISFFHQKYSIAGTTTCYRIALFYNTGLELSSELAKVQNVNWLYHEKWGVWTLLRSEINYWREKRIIQWWKRMIRTYVVFRSKECCKHVCMCMYVHSRFNHSFICVEFDHANHQ